MEVDISRGRKHPLTQYSTHGSGCRTFSSKFFEFTAPPGSTAAPFQKFKVCWCLELFGVVVMHPESYLTWTKLPPIYNEFARKLATNIQSVTSVQRVMQFFQKFCMNKPQKAAYCLPAKRERWKTMLNWFKSLALSCNWHLCEVM